MPDDASGWRVRMVADAICEVGASWIKAPLHRMAYEDMARAAIAAILATDQAPRPKATG